MTEARSSAILSRHWDGYLPVNIEAIAESMGAVVSRWPNMGETSGIIQMQNGAPAIYVNVQDAPVRQRFTIAHELGHWALGHLKHEGQTLPRDNKMTYSMSSTPIEREANKFAAALLMPADAVRYVLQNGFAITLEDLARMFGVSRAAMKFRVHNIGLFSAI